MGEQDVAVGPAVDLHNLGVEHDHDLGARIAEEGVDEADAIIDSGGVGGADDDGFAGVLDSADADVGRDAGRRRRSVERRNGPARWTSGSVRSPWSLFRGRIVVRRGTRRSRRRRVRAASGETPGGRGNR